MKLKERVENNVYRDWWIHLFQGIFWKLKGKGTGFTKKYVDKCVFFSVKHSIALYIKCF